MSKSAMWRLLRCTVQKSNLFRSGILLQENTRFYDNIIKRGYVSPRSDNPINIDYHEVKTYKQFLDEYPTGPGAAVVNLMDVLDIPKHQAVEAVKCWKGFGGLCKTTLIKNQMVLRDGGVLDSTISKNIYVLADKTSNVKKKLESLSKIKLDVNNAIPLFQLTAEELSLFSEMTIHDRLLIPGYNNRIEYLVNRLNFELYEFCIILCHNRIMLRNNMAKVIDITEYLLSIGIEGRWIGNDLVVYGYTLERIKFKIAAAIDAGVSPLKPWVVRCPEHKIAKIKERNKTRKIVFDKAQTVEEYISQKLNCDIASVNAVLNRDPGIRSINAKQLSKILDILRSSGYTISDIFRTTRCLHCNPETVQQNYDTWCAQNLCRPTLSTICTSTDVFEKKNIIK